MDFGGEGNHAMARVPGYGDFLEEYDPEIRERQSNVGAPSGFEDAVCWMGELSGEQLESGVRPHWAVTFSVDDCDQAVRRAEELGAKLLVPPFDMPPVRVATLADPQGAVFTVSKYTP